MKDTKEIKIFIAYSRLDIEFLNELKTFLSPLIRNKSIAAWHDGEIIPGEVWEDKIKQALHATEIFLLLVSANSLASDYFYDKEVSNALLRCQKGECEVVPIILKPCGWRETPLETLQALPQNGKPVTTWSNKDEAYQSIYDGLKVAIKKIQGVKNLKEEEEKKQRAKEEKKTIAKDLKKSNTINPSINTERQTTGNPSEYIPKKSNLLVFTAIGIIVIVGILIVSKFFNSNNENSNNDKIENIPEMVSEEADTSVSSKIYSQGQLTIVGSYIYDLDLGTPVENSESSKAEFHYLFVSENERYFSPYYGTFCFLGHRDFNLISITDLVNFPYSGDKINASNNASNKLTVGAVVAAKTNEGRYSKFIIEATGLGQWGNDITISWITYELVKNNKKD